MYFHINQLGIIINTITPVPNITLTNPKEYNVYEF